MTESRCPTCGVDTTANREAVEDGNVLTCMNCGYVGIWDTDGAHGWRLPTNAERADLMTDEHYLRALEYQMVTRSWAERDRASIINAVKSAVYGKHFCQTVEHDVDEIARWAADLIIRQGFHTHPNPGEAEALEALDEQ